MNDNTTDKPLYTVSVKPSDASASFQLLGEILVENKMAQDIITAFLMEERTVPNELFKYLH